VSETIQIEREVSRAVIRLCRPEVHNAFDDRMIRDLTAAMKSLSVPPLPRVVIVRSEGASFSAGADMEWMRRMKDYSAEENERDAREMATMFQALRACPCPVIARVQGAAIGGGTGLVAACDIAVASANAVFAFSEVRLGLIPAVISPLVIERIGVTAAKRYMLTGLRFDATEAQRIGLVAEVVEDEAALDERVEAIAAAVEASGPAAVTACKLLIEDVAQRPPEELFDETARRIAALRVSPEGQEGLDAFLEKRRPNWRSATQ
jgi:methylglutaconyl-CoA hydratase